MDNTEHCFEYVRENITWDEIFEWFLEDFMNLPFMKKTRVVEEIRKVWDEEEVQL